MVSQKKRPSTARDNETGELSRRVAEAQVLYFRMSADLKMLIPRGLLTDRQTSLCPGINN